MNCECDDWDWPHDHCERENCEQPVITGSHYHCGQCDSGKVTGSYGHYRNGEFVCDQR